MSRLCCALLIGMIVTGSRGRRAGAEEHRPEPLRVLSYNIHHAEGIDGRLDLPRIAAVIESVRPDLVALQEVDRVVKRSGSVDQPAELARLTGMKVAFGGNISLQGGHYGNAILSRFPILQHENRLLPNVDRGEQRGVLDARIDVPGWSAPLRLLATHLDHRRDSRERVASAKAINALIASDRKARVLLAGDLNAVIGSEPLDVFETRWTHSSTNPLPTIPVAEPERQIDFVLFRPANRWRVIEVRVLDESVASDHRPLLAVLQPIAAVDQPPDR